MIDDRLGDGEPGERGGGAVGERRVGPLRAGHEATGHEGEQGEDGEGERRVRPLVDDERPDRRHRYRDDEHDRRTEGDGAEVEVLHHHATSPHGLASPSLPGLRMPFGSRACFSASKTAKAGPIASAT